jgi:hypothetical protein
MSRFKENEVNLMDFIKQIAHAIDTLRIDRRLTVESLCFGICDTSSYRRYKSGDRHIPIERIKLFCDKLGIGLDEFLYNLSTNHDVEYQKINHLYTLLLHKKYEDISNELKQIHIKDLSLEKHKTFYDFILYTNQFETNQISSEVYYENLEKLQKKVNDFYTFNDLIILEKMAWIEIDRHETTSLDLLSSIILDRKTLYGLSNMYAALSSIMSNVANMYNKLDLYEQSNNICEAGIVYMKKYNTYQHIYVLYYLLAYNHKMLDNLELSQKYLAMTLTHLFSLDLNKDYLYIVSLIKDEFNLDKDALMHIVSHAIKIF